MIRRSSAHYLLQGLGELGIEYIFGNLGTDHVSLIEELARWDVEGRSRPQVVLCPHENVAVHMAGGYALMTGRGQAVLVHVDAGTANAAMPMHNLFRSRLPVLLMAGRAPFSIHGELRGSRDHYVHFVQDPYDIANLVRSYVKWEYNLPSGVVVKQALRRGQALMQSDPPGPVYLTLPRETLAEEWDEAAIRSYPEAPYGAVKLGGVEAVAAERIADELMRAENPIAITAYVGRNPQAPAVLEALAQECGIRVAEFNPIYLNMSHNSPCFAGFDPAALMEGADLGLLLDVDVPFIPKSTPRASALRWLQIDVDAIKKDFPIWGFASDLRIQADCAIVLGQVLAIVRSKADESFRSRVAQRLARWEGANAQWRKRAKAAARKTGEVDALTPDYVCAVLNAKLSQDDIVINEAISNSGAVLQQIERTRPQTYVGLAGGGLGFAGGAGLGIKLARPQARVVQIVGDGAFHFSTPDSVYSVAQTYGLPVFTVILDNGGWQAVKQSVLRVYPDGAAAKTDLFQSRLESARQGDQRRLEDVARAFGAYGECCRDPADLAAAIDRCLKAVDDGQAAVLNVRVTPL
jgi:acetolactate synthase-1/2/3 large subunit